MDKSPAVIPAPAAAPATEDEDDDEEDEDEEEGAIGNPVEKSSCGVGSGGTEKSFSMNSMRMTSRDAL